MIANVLVKNAWYAAGLSGAFKPGELVGQVVAEKPLVLWRTPAGTQIARSGGATQLPSSANIVTVPRAE